MLIIAAHGGQSHHRPIDVAFFAISCMETVDRLAPNYCINLYISVLGQKRYRNEHFTFPLGGFKRIASSKDKCKEKTLVKEKAVHTAIRNTSPKYWVSL